MFLNIVTAIELLNHFQIIHTDLNFRNIFIKENHRFAIKIGDFGCSIKIMDDKKTQYTAVNWQGDEKLRAPELKQGFYTPKTDIYTLGIIFEYLFSL
jgi:serine/threonine protein kinase